ncbi:glutamate--cysteine ligase [Enterococcus sp. PF1-24]|uniref:bifunctional glutamate--cysteine ligase GshA/glutathione synthetase GshB n=1 Tax=unclassified Enterococcus TaxID=2608891 RepID=UPI002476C9EE|nr:MULTISPECIES: bifunctional glutamate--cysteine ligase GshA/glutathione synthetase GshB [unclassified Enterococcus]MDH6363832.1 glutamate--cysteine ligase [Enterococcus sp. PFB1-1]MDH6400982.1 glutamate--cysteine ligase [Enterococcus sp. PF1-24]
MNFKELLSCQQVQPYLLEVRLGLEKESQRVDLQGHLATTEHPAVLGCRSYHPYIQTDFSETQLELITPVVNSRQDLMRSLAAIHDVTLRSMATTEMLWPLSMPPALPENEAAIQIAKLAKFEDVLYRRYLAKTYGKRKQMVSGIHFNFEFAESLIQALFKQQTEIAEIEVFKTQVYMKVSRNFLRYRWLITYLYGVAPLSEANYFAAGEGPKEPVRSIRSSQYGYTNHSDVKVSYASLEKYIADIALMVESGKLSEEKEFYAPIRLRGGHKMSELAASGIRYVELRNIDLNPFERIGIQEEQLHFLQLFMLYLLWTEEKLSADEWVALGDQYNNQVALEQPQQPTALQAEGELIFEEMLAMLKALDLTEELPFIESLQKRLTQPAETLAARWLAAVEETSQAEVATKFAEKYQQKAYEKPYQLAGYRGMELSTQIFLFDAIQKGITVEILDESEQFLKLRFASRTEYVKNANMTSRDNYIVPLIMENKTVTKKVLATAGFRVPAGAEFNDMALAEKAFPQFAAKAFVIKPKTTNYGLGITIFKDGASFADYQAGLAIAFQEDQAVLVEEFLPGTEYRFFVLDGAVQAVMLRVPANVIGDGQQTIAQLVAEKNQDPLRGSHHRAPLELIQLGEVEKLMLKAQGFTVESVPAKSEVVYLRENSNISTGGDSIDMTDEMPAVYKEIAVAAVKALGAEISGIDLIIPDYQQPATIDSDNYGVIEANFNPAMHMHIYPYQGSSRRLTMAVLKLLYPEAFNQKC